MKIIRSPIGTPFELHLCHHTFVVMQPASQIIKGENSGWCAIAYDGTIIRDIIVSDNIKFVYKIAKSWARSK